MRFCLKFFWVLVSPTLIFLLFAPVFSFSLMGDDFQLLQHVHQAFHQPRLLVSDFDSFTAPPQFGRWPWTVFFGIAGQGAFTCTVCSFTVSWRVRCF